LQLLRVFLEITNPDRKFRISSIWLDKFPICRPLAASGCRIAPRELGDLGILVRGRVGNTLLSRFSILQGKLFSTGWKRKGQSPKEIELYEKCPAFDLFTSANANAIGMGQFDLKTPPGFGSPPYSPHSFPFWNFLMFQPSSSLTTIVGTKAIAHHWNSGSGNVMSFADGIQAMVTNLGASNYEHGALVDSTANHKEWRRLFWTLWIHSGRAILGAGKLSGGTWRKSALIDNFLLARDIYHCFPFIKTTPKKSIDLFTNRQFQNALISERFMLPPGEDTPAEPNSDDSGGINWLIIDSEEVR
jgi:hypothetical protein